jgi:hypothetical protein
LANIFPSGDRRLEAILALQSVCNRILNTSSQYDVENRHELNCLKNDIVEALCKCESVLPRTDLPVMLHVLLHVPEAIHRWNAVRNYWSFFTERCAGYLIRFIHNRDLAAENIMTAAVRMRSVVDCAPGGVHALREKIRDAGYALPQLSMLHTADEIVV